MNVKCCVYVCVCLYVCVCVKMGQVTVMICVCGVCVCVNQCLFFVKLYFWADCKK